MPERLRKQVLGGSPRGWLLGCALSVASVSVLAADALPASVRACSALTDSLQRLVCYDREVAKFPAPAAKAAGKSAPMEQQEADGQAAGLGGPAAASAGTASGGGGAGGGARGAAATRSASSGSSAAAAPSAAPKSNSTVGSDSSGDAAHIAAHIVSIDHQPNAMILHLDNGQVWQEVQSVSGDLSLREGDAVKIDRHLGSYWLSGPHVSSMKVQRKT